MYILGNDSFSREISSVKEAWSNIHCLKYLKERSVTNTNALIVRLIARFELIWQKHVRPVISLVTDQG